LNITLYKDNNDRTEVILVVGLRSKINGCLGNNEQKKSEDKITSESKKNNLNKKGKRRRRAEQIHRQEDKSKVTKLF
jgi:hypothetical protein